MSLGTILLFALLTFGDQMTDDAIDNEKKLHKSDKHEGISGHPRRR